MTAIVVPIAAISIEHLARKVAQAHAGGADLVELRLDTSLVQVGSLEALYPLLNTLRQLPLPVLVTLRHRSEGGTWDGPTSERQRLYAHADRNGAAYIDQELATDDGWRPTHAKLVLSHHNFASMSPDLDGIIQRMHAAGADVAKIAVMPHDAADLADIARCYRHAKGAVCAIAMGEIGLPSRLLAGCWNAAFTFARLDGDEGSAPGQPTVRELSDRYRLHQQNADTRIFGVIGNPIHHSLSPHIHNAAIDEQNINAVYVPFLVHDPVAFWKACGKFIDGLSITIPHKHDLIPLMNRCEPLVTRIGAMNTIWRDADGNTVGANTDAVAAMACLEEETGSLTGKKAILLGAGGVARAIAFALADRGAKVCIVNRSHDRADALAKEMGGSVADANQAHQQPFDIIINGTSVGMEAPTNSPWPADRHHRNSVVFDTVYTPLETRLIKDAQLAEARTVSGLSMFIGQAAEQYQRFFGLAAPTDVMHRVALERLEAKAKAKKSVMSRDTVDVEREIGGG